jgi:hypothetical protein
MKTVPLKPILFLLGAWFCASQVAGQSSKNALFFELGGNGFAYGFHYDRQVYQDIHARAGFSIFRVIENQTEKTLLVMSYPLSCNYLYNLSGEKHFLEGGIGLMNLVTTGDLVEYKGITNYYLNPFLNLGYLYKPPGKKWIYKAGLTPFFGTKSVTNPTEQGFEPFGNAFQIWGTIGVGYQL